MTELGLRAYEEESTLPTNIHDWVASNKTLFYTDDDVSHSV